jgi:hypothetical protein
LNKILKKYGFEVEEIEDFSELENRKKDVEEGRMAVREIARHLYDENGGIIAQFEFGAEINPLIGFAIFDEWDKVAKGRKVNEVCNF